MGRSLTDIMQTACAARVLGRDEEVEAMAVAYVAEANLLMVGPPGTGKTFLAETFARIVEDPAGFAAVLMHQQILQEEVIGGVILKDMDNGVFSRNLSGGVADAGIVFLDEIFKSSPGIYNTLLRLLNERSIRNGGREVKTPLQSAFAASNEWPFGDGHDSSGALWDRFHIRLKSNRLMPAMRKRLLRFVPAAVDPMPALQDAVKTCRELMADVKFEDATYDRVVECCESEGMDVSERRYMLGAKILRSKTVCSGRLKAETDDYLFLSHVLWDHPDVAAACRRAVRTALDEGADSAAVEAAMQAYKDAEDTLRSGSSDLISALAAVKAVNEAIEKLPEQSGTRAALHRKVGQLLEVMPVEGEAALLS